MAIHDTKTKKITYFGVISVHNLIELGCQCCIFPRFLCFFFWCIDWYFIANCVRAYPVECLTYRDGANGDAYASHQGPAIK